MINFSVQTEYSIDEELLTEHMPEGFEGGAIDLIEQLLLDRSPEDFGAEEEYQEVFIF